jgi:hypothetical protein
MGNNFARMAAKKARFRASFEKKPQNAICGNHSE